MREEQSITSGYIAILIGFGIEISIWALSMTDLVLPTWLIWLFFASGIGLIIYGLFLNYRSSRITRNKIKEQRDVITELEICQWRRAMREPFLVELTEILQKMHKQLLAIVDKKALLATDEKAVFEVTLDLIEKLGIRLRFIPQNTKPPLSRIRTLYFMLQISKSFKKNKELKYLHNLSGEMDRRGIGLIQEKKTNQKYKALSQHLTRLRAKVVSDELNTAIDTYLLYSYALSSYMLFNLYLGLFTKGYEKWIRVKYRHRISETQMRDAIDIQMNRLLANVAKHVEEALLGERPK